MKRKPHTRVHVTVCVGGVCDEQEGDDDEGKKKKNHEIKNSIYL